MKYKIKEIREKKRISQTELAKLSGVSRQTIIALETKDDVDTTVGTLNSIATALGVSVKSLFFTDGV
jgi:putative transcriptional regulator